VPFDDMQTAIEAVGATPMEVGYKKELRP